MEILTLVINFICFFTAILSLADAIKRNIKGAAIYVFFALILLQSLLSIIQYYTK